MTTKLNNQIPNSIRDEIGLAMQSDASGDADDPKIIGSRPPSDEESQALRRRGFPDSSVEVVNMGGSRLAPAWEIVFALRGRDLLYLES